MAKARAVTPEEPSRRLWVYHGPDRIYAYPAIRVTDGDTIEWHEEPPTDGCWAPAGEDDPTEPTIPVGAMHRIWTPEELAHGPVPALEEHWESTDAEVAAAQQTVTEEVEDNA